MPEENSTKKYNLYKVRKEIHKLELSCSYFMEFPLKERKKALKVNFLRAIFIFFLNIF